MAVHASLKCPKGQNRYLLPPRHMPLLFFLAASTRPRNCCALVSQSRFICSSTGVENPPMANPGFLFSVRLRIFCLFSSWIRSASRMLCSFLLRARTFSFFVFGMCLATPRNIHEKAPLKKRYFLGLGCCLRRRRLALSVASSRSFFLFPWPVLADFVVFFVSFFLSMACFILL